jgi:surface protein
MENMFMGACGANPSISKWDVSNVKDMYQMFGWNQKFDDDISNWNVGNVRNMGLMFYESGFNGDLSKWDVSKVQDMHGMFSSSSFKGNNGSLNNWNVSNVTNMRGMFRSTFFNSDISNWDVSNVIHMNGIFYNSTFNKDISNWDINPVANTKEMFDRCDIIDEYKPKKLIKESFDFDSIDKGKKTINAYEKLPIILEKVLEYKDLTKDEYYILTSMVGVYKVKNTDKLKSVINYFIK